MLSAGVVFGRQPKATDVLPKPSEKSRESRVPAASLHEGSIDHILPIGDLNFLLTRNRAANVDVTQSTALRSDYSLGMQRRVSESLSHDPEPVMRCSSSVSKGVT